MFNKIILLSFMLFFLLLTNVSAHSHLKDSSPKNGEVITEALENISLTFETKIDPASTFSLLDATGKIISLSAPEQNVNNDNTNTDQTEETKQVVKETAPMTKEAIGETPTFKNYIIPVLIGLLITIGFSSYWLVFRRKNA